MSISAGTLNLNTTFSSLFSLIFPTSTFSSSEPSNSRSLAILFPEESKIPSSATTSLMSWSSLLSIVASISIVSNNLQASSSPFPSFLMSKLLTDKFVPFSPFLQNPLVNEKDCETEFDP